MNRSSVMLSSIEDYYMGGITEITEEIRRCTFYFNRWFTDPIPTDPWSICATFYGKRPHSTDLRLAKPPISSFNLMPEDSRDELLLQRHNNKHVSINSPHSQSLFGYSITIGKFFGHDNGDVAAISSPYEIEHTSNLFQPDTGSVYLIRLSKLVSQFQGQLSPLIPRKIGIESPPHSIDERLPLNTIFPFASVLTHMNLLGNDILVVAHPGSSAIKFYYHGQTAFEIYWPDASTLFGTSGLKLIGETMVTGDLDEDGIEDLIIGAPKSDDNRVPQRGKVYVIYGVTLQAMLKSTLKNRHNQTDWQAPRIQVDKVTHTTIIPPSIRINGYEQFGSQISIGSTKDSISGKYMTYLIISAPGLGEIYVYDTIKGTKLPIETLTLGTKSGGIFGDSLLLSTSDGWIFAGASTCNLGEFCTQCGEVYAFQISMHLGIVESSLRAILEPDYSVSRHSFERFGSHGSLTRGKLYISSPFAARGKGRVWALDLKDLEIHSSSKLLRFKANILRTKPTSFSEVRKIRVKSMAKGKNKHTHFGHNIATSDIPGDKKSELLFVCEPYVGMDRLSEVSRQLTGSVNIYKVSKSG